MHSSWISEISDLKTREIKLTLRGLKNWKLREDEEQGKWSMRIKYMQGMRIKYMQGEDLIVRGVFQNFKFYMHTIMMKPT